MGYQLGGRKMHKKRNIVLAVVVICVLFVGAYILNLPTSTKQDTKLNVGEWNTIYEANELHTKKGVSFGIVNDANNYDEIYVRVLDENQEVIYEPFYLSLGRKKILDSIKNGYIIQAQPVEVNEYYRITLIEY